ncbi:uncharacterized protein BDW43DRAFT_242805 [Aspergillus alliaceus]|uniref:uncharacterized protein n=1 Tax=Petromyces alliaceus TaxID=209559 RepID=UPI0012A47B48|nr:uncharacterized protein BDW43DRAFT_242805 [Aspergillus alliaceus]KAB8227622.1 hypothetical protein BDW43DRAFT_242805 [Aspergillus alliaceus]
MYLMSRSETYPALEVVELPWLAGKKEFQDRCWYLGYGGRSHHLDTDHTIRRFAEPLIAVMAAAWGIFGCFAGDQEMQITMTGVSGLTLSSYTPPWKPPYGRS